MTPKERVRTTVQLQQPDRVATNMMCVAEEWHKLKKHFNVETEDEVKDLLEIDIRDMDMPDYLRYAEHMPYKNENGQLVLWHPFGFEFFLQWNGHQNTIEVCRPFPYNAVESIEDIETFDGWLNPDDFDYDSVKRFVDKHQDYALQIGWPGPFQVFSMVYDFEIMFENLYEEPELMQAMLDKYCDRSLEMYERMFEAGEGQIDLLRTCDDYGSQSSLLFGPNLFEEFFAENTKRFTDLAHKNNAFFLQHSCGAIRPIIPNLIECGVDIIEPLQKVAGLEPEGLKADFGDKVCFQGGIDTQHLLPEGTPEEVAEETRRFIKALNPGGGYILTASQYFQADTPVENVIAVYETRKEFD